MQWYGVWNLDTQEHYPLYCANREHLERIVARMNINLKRLDAADAKYTIRKVDIDRVLGLK